MPKKSKHPCGYLGCPQLIDAGQRYCEKHKQPDRPSAAKRGYNSKWRRLSKAYLRKHPMCVYAVCSKDDTFLQLWSTTYNRIVAALL